MMTGKYQDSPGVLKSFLTAYCSLLAAQRLSVGLEQFPEESSGFCSPAACFPQSFLIFRQERRGKEKRGRFFKSNT